MRMLNVRSSHLRITMGVLALWVLLIASAAFGQSVEATVDRSSIGPSDTVTLSVTVSGVRRANVAQPDGGDFTVAGRSTSSRFSMNNGQMASSTNTSFRLIPRRTGTLTIPSIAVQTESGILQTDPITVTVGASGTMPALPQPTAIPVRPQRPAPQPATSTQGTPRFPAPSGSSMETGEVAADALGQPFLVAQVSDTSPYVGQQVVIDYLYFVPVFELGTDVSDLTEPEFTGMWFRDITEERGSRRMGSQSIRGELYDVQLIRSYIVVPLNEGETAVPSVGLEVRRIGFYRNQSRLALTSLPLTLDVLPLPEEGRPAGFHAGNVGDFHFDVRVNDPAPRVGDTVRVDVRATGVSLMTGVQLPHQGPINGLRTFDPDEDITFDVGPSGWVEGTVSHDIAMVPEREGSFTIPSLSFDYFNPWTESYETATSEPVLITAEGVNPNAAVNTDREQQEDAVWAEALPPSPELPSEGTVRGSSQVGPLYWLLAGLPPLFFFGWLLFGRVKAQREAARPERERRDVGRTSTRAIIAAASDDLPAVVARELRTFVAVKSVKTTRGLTLSDLRTAATTLGGRTWGAALAECVERAELARYAGADADALSALRDDALEVISTFGGRS